MFIRKKWRGSYTVEATVVISTFCIIIVLTILIGFYSHDYLVAKSTARYLASEAALWSGRYVSPSSKEVDYGAMKQSLKVSFDQIEEEGHHLLEKRLLYGKIRSIRIYESFLRESVKAEIVVEFYLWRWLFSRTVQSEIRLYKSSELPRNIRETGETE